MYVLNDQRAAGVSARQERVPARYVRAACSVFGVMQTTVWGLAYRVFAPQEGALAPSWLKASRIFK